MSNTIKKNVHLLLDELGTYIDRSMWRDKYHFAIATLQAELNAPCVLAVAGRVKAGKSCLVNSLLGIDLAMTGTTETTATINIFKKGDPPSKEKPILCIYVDGHKDWVSKEFLDSLQGTSDEALSKTAQIEKLIMYISDNPLLDYVTLVDTPGIGAEVGEDGDSHQIHTDTYFKLRERHQQDTINLSNTADAVIYLFNTVPTETDKSFLSSLYDGGNGLTSINGIGVLSKVDKDITQIGNIPKFEKEFERNLFTIMPTSAALEKYLPSKEKAVELRKILKKGFSEEKGFVLGMGSETAFLHDKLPFCNLSVQERKDILDGFSKNDLAWSSFSHIAKEIYYADDIDVALQKIKNIGGIEQLRNLIFEHFFKRSNLLRCNKVLDEQKRIINSITYDEKYVFAEDNAMLKEECLDACKMLSPKVKSIFCKLVNENIPSLDQVKKEKDRLLELKKKLEFLQHELRIVNDSYMTYQKVILSKEQFSDIEFDELCNLFSDKPINANIAERYKYWKGISNLSPVNSIRQQAALIAQNKYIEYLK